MVKKIIGGIIAACIILGIYRAVNGDVGSILDTVGSVIVQVLDKGSEFIAKMWNSVF